MADVVCCCCWVGVTILFDLFIVVHYFLLLKSLVTLTVMIVARTELLTMLMSMIVVFHVDFSRRCCTRCHDCLVAAPPPSARLARSLWTWQVPLSSDGTAL